jgi:hypothetical protein
MEGPGISTLRQAIRSRPAQASGPGQTASPWRDAETSRNEAGQVIAMARSRPADRVRIRAAVLVAYGAQFRAVATRYAKRELMCEGTVALPRPDLALRPTMIYKAPPSAMSPSEVG